jgi:hypothetical protein
MSNLIEITSADIQQLGDTDLRTLIGLLCEADFRLSGISTRGITWGGSQDAGDGGLDVVVRSEVPPPSTSYIPRSITGFQVKKPDMSPSNITREMRPNNVLRESIKTLIKNEGAYIIVSSNTSATNTMLKNRTQAMRDAISTEKGNKNLFLDFYDQNRIASWVRTHSSLILWVRNKIGRFITGWYPYDNWANPSGGIGEEYLFDNELRLHDGIRNNHEDVSVKNGINRLRLLLSVPGKSLRLTGLSGVGKTRLAQAIFDERVGEKSLNPAQVFYTDISYSPNPEPRVFAEQLVASNDRAILIIDNCPPDLHRQLTKICTGLNSTVSLLTIEYDVRDDIPDETTVFRLEPASEEVIRKLINKRFQHISHIDAQTIANFSGGNARLAIALANTVQQGETLSEFHDENLFERLFRQRQDASENLLRSAEVCSLVYSFEGTDTNSEKSELKLLASIIGRSGPELYHDVNTLKKRDLVQSRDVWRAVLPHAIANRLASRALESIPKDILVDTFLRDSSERLIQSFSRRLSYLHDCKPAIEIVEEWLEPDGWLGKANCDFNSFGMAVFLNIGPVSPEKVLEAIERAANGENGQKFTSRDNVHFHEFANLLRRLAYDPDLFDRSVNILCRYALSEKQEENHHSVRNILRSLFNIYLSGTHATIEARYKIIVAFSNSDKQEEQELGLSLLNTTLNTSHFSSSYDFRFGARSRDYGYHPKTQKEITLWYDAFVGICSELATSDIPIAQKARRLIADNMRGLWTFVGLFEVLEKSAKAIHEKRAWNEGWVAIREIIQIDAEHFDKEILEKLYKLERFLRPSDLLERARTYIFSDQFLHFDLEDDLSEEDTPSRWSQMEEKTRQLGIQVAKDRLTFNALLPDLVSIYGSRLHAFGKGLADGWKNKEELWEILYEQFKKTSPEKRVINVLLGFLELCANNDQKIYNLILDKLIDDDLLGEWFPILQASSKLDKNSVERLCEAANKGKAKTHTFRYIGWGGVHKSISDDELVWILQAILKRQDSIDVVIEILQMRFHDAAQENSTYSTNLIALTRQVLLMYPFDEQLRTNQIRDYDLTQLARICLDGKDGIRFATEFSQGLAKAITEYRIYMFDYANLLSLIALNQPFVFLDEFLENLDIKNYELRGIFNSEIHSNPLNQISDNDLLSWSDKDPENRYPLLAATIQTYFKSDDLHDIEWRPIVYSMFENAPDINLVFEKLEASLLPTSWSGSLADIMQNKSVLFQKLCQHENEKVRNWATNQYVILQKKYEERRKWEKSQNRTAYERFE